MSNTPKPTAVEPYRAAADARQEQRYALEHLAEGANLLPSTDPRAIVVRTFLQPFATEVRIDAEDLPAGAVTRKKTSVGERMEIDLGGLGGAAVVNKVTPEQLLAVVASIIATSSDATKACQRIRAEVAGWKFQGADGTIR